MNALIVVDMQNGFVAKELPVPGAAEIIPVVNRLMMKFPLVVATQDWHPANHQSFASRHRGKKPFEEGTVDGRPHTLWPDHCVMGTWGAAFAEGLDTRPFAAIFRKGMHHEVDSYSGFYDDRGVSHPTGLAGYLRERNVKEVHVCGLALDYCVRVTALDAARLGYPVHVHASASRAVSEDGQRGALKDFKKAGVTLIRCDWTTNK
jgi:nicotinamidase/pyrazinamidase